MFKINPEPFFWASVPLTVPGQAKPVVVQMEFKHHDKEAWDAEFKRLQTLPDEEQVMSVVRDWKEMDEPFSPEAVKKLVTNYHSSGQEIFQAYGRELIGSKVKN